MRYLLVGLGGLGARRKALLGDRCVATVDPINPAADHREPADHPLDTYDAAVLSVPNAPKLDLVAWFLEHGKSVLVDKPLLFPDEAAADRLDRLARANRVVWYTSYNHRFEPMIAEAKRRIDAGAIGRLYHARLLYGNGTVGNVRGSWRDAGLGVLEDLGSHVLDLAAYVFGYGGARFCPVVVNHHESVSPDQAILRSEDGRLALETSFVSWRNTFALEAWGERGSLHVHGLRKWGPVELIARERVLPSGMPREERLADAGPDETWQRDFEHFERCVAAGSSSLENDRWISKTFAHLESTT